MSLSGLSKRSRKQTEMLRFGFSFEDMQDKRLQRALDHKMVLDNSCKALKGAQYTSSRLARLGKQFGFLTSDLANVPHLARLLKSIIDSELYLRMLQSSEKESA